MNRRQFLAGVGTVGTTAFAGCGGDDDSDDGPDLVRKTDCEAGVLLYRDTDGDEMAAVPLNDTDLNESEVCPDE